MSPFQLERAGTVKDVDSPSARCKPRQMTARENRHVLPRARRYDRIIGTAHWYKGGKGLVPIRWVFVHDLDRTHRDEYLYTTDTTLHPEQIIAYFTARWPIETTFQEMRRHLGFETPRQRVAKSVLRTGPCLLGLFSVICLIFAAHARRHRIRLRTTAWYRKTESTFSDAIATVRRLFWSR